MSGIFDLRIIMKKNFCSELLKKIMGDYGAAAAPKLRDKWNEHESFGQRKSQQQKQNI